MCGIAANIEALGFSLRDVQYLTHTQEHGDHIGGTAYLKSRTGARLVASPRAQSVFETGVINTDDPQYVRDEPKEWLTVDKLVADGEALVLDGKRIVAHFTPGHSPGAISWRWKECQEDRCHTVVFTDGMGPFSADAHPSQMRLIERIEAGTLVEQEKCSLNATSIQERIDIIIEEERRQ
jgi:metallo-beta-lactamase class B